MKTIFLGFPATFLLILTIIGCKGSGSKKTEAMPVCPEYLSTNLTDSVKPNLMFSVAGLIDSAGSFQGKRIESHLVQNGKNLDEAKSTWTKLFENAPDKMGECVVSAKDIEELLNVKSGMRMVGINHADKITTEHIQSFKFYSDCEGHTLHIDPDKVEGFGLYILGTDNESVALLSRKMADDKQAKEIQGVVEDYLIKNPNEKKRLLDLNGLEKENDSVKKLHLSDFEMDVYKLNSSSYQYLVSGEAKTHYCHPNFMALVSRDRQVWLSPQLIFVQTFTVGPKSYFYGYLSDMRCANGGTGVVFSIDSYPPQAVHAQAQTSCN